MGVFRRNRVKLFSENLWETFVEITCRILFSRDLRNLKFITSHDDLVNRSVHDVSVSRLISLDDNNFRETQTI